MFLGIFAITAITLILFWHKVNDTSSQKIELPSIHSTNVEGVKVYYTLLKEFDFEPIAFEKQPLLHLDELDVLFALGDIYNFPSYEIDELKKWMINGGILVINFPLMDYYFNNDNHLSVSYASNSYDTNDNQKRKSISVSTISFFERNQLLSRDVSEVALRTKNHFEKNDRKNLNNESTRSKVKAEILFTDSEGPRITQVSMGAGKMIVMSDMSFMQNGLIGKKDNSILATNLSAYCKNIARGNRLGFDEYHFGYGDHETGWYLLTMMLFESSPGWSCLCLALAGILYLFYKGRRFGIRRAPANNMRRRAKLEFVQSVGLTLNHINAHFLAFKINYQWFLKHVAKQTGLAFIHDHKLIAKTVAHQLEKPPETYLNLFNQCEIILAEKKLSKNQFHKIMTQLGQLEKEIFPNGHS